jgi:hypothetical protein
MKFSIIISSEQEQKLIDFMEKKLLENKSQAIRYLINSIEEKEEKEK